MQKFCFIVKGLNWGSHWVSRYTFSYVKAAIGFHSFSSIKNTGITSQWILRKYTVSFLLSSYCFPFLFFLQHLRRPLASVFLYGSILTFLQENKDGILQRSHCFPFILQWWHYLTMELPCKGNGDAIPTFKAAPLTVQEWK